MEDVEYLPIMSNEFLSDVVCYVYPNYPHEPSGFYAWSGQLKSAMDCYIEEQIPNLSNKLVQYCGTIFENNTKLDIDNGRPSILSMWQYTIKDSGGNIIERRSDHCLIAYGYKGDMYKVTDPNRGNAMYISTGLIFTNYSIGYTGVHMHSSTLRFKNYDCWGMCCPCGYKVYNHSGTVDSNHKCTSCGTVVDHKWEYVHVGSSSFHKLECKYCNATITEDHILVSGPLNSVYCICGYDSSEFGEITLGDPNHDEDL